MPRQTDRQWATDVSLELITAQRFLEALTNSSLDHDVFADDSSDESSDSDLDDTVVHGESLSTRLIGALIDLHSTRYINERRDIEKTEEIVSLLLGSWKENRPEIFRDYLRIMPAAFDKLIEGIEDDPIFSNNSDTAEQLSIQHQLAITLYRFGHYGNGASIRLTAHLFGVGYGTVPKCTARVISALCRDRFRRSAIRWLEDGSEEKEAAKAWVEEQDRSCPAWRDAWVMVDGTLVPLYARPGHFGNSWYDRKSNYSLNVQIINTPNLRIVDYGVGLPGKHAVGYLKGRFPSLKGLRLRIDNKEHQLFATVWVIACMVVHNFCMEHERLTTRFELDTFFQEGRRIMEEEQAQKSNDDQNDEEMDSVALADARDIELLEAQIKHEKLKQALFDF
ncbi:DDE Tnp4 domain-containing protein [Mycena venus]|uniref:DDE Tnp4 domain-containing protein n=1 Tax=Mycena venus TaxID=2733690 RepID=A0A8H6YHQ4_9AGAR|nr:DDE Tnp4 domain-containing protein [Mycena venus]